MSFWLVWFESFCSFLGFGIWIDDTLFQFDSLLAVSSSDSVRISGGLIRCLKGYGCTGKQGEWLLP